jgi:hypothetical protein
MVSTNVVGGAASACLASRALASAVASDAMVPRKADVAKPVARMRPAAATCRRRLPNNQTLVWRSTTGTVAVSARSITIFAATGALTGGLQGAEVA